MLSALLSSRLLPTRLTTVLARLRLALAVLTGGSAPGWAAWQTGRKTPRERELEDKVALLQTTLDHTSHGIQMVDRDGRVVVVNRRAIELLDLPREVMETRPYMRDLAMMQLRNGDLDELPPEIRRRIDAGEDLSAVDLTYRRRRRDGRLLEIQNSLLEGGGAVRTHTDITLREAADAKISFMARHDGLTGLANRHLFLDQLHGALRQPGGTALLCLDLDRFKQVNDTLGHPVGDALLRSVAGRLLAVAGPGDTVARLGGDEFAIIRAPVGHVAEAGAFAAALIGAVGRPFEIEGHHIVVGASIGVAVAWGPTGDRPSIPAGDRPNIPAGDRPNIPAGDRPNIPAGDRPAPDPDALLRHADLALYEAKAEGRGTHRMFEPRMEESLLKRHQMEQDLRRAMADGTFEMYYQPLVDIRTGGITGFEALLRWRHPSRGIVSAGEFIPLAESIGVIGRLGQWVLHRACADAASWPAHVRIAVNLSPMQFRSPGLVAMVRTALSEHGLAPQRLELEVTESVLLRDTEETLATLRALRALGVRLALDDFGTGYSSLAYLRNFPFDRLKIDQSFISGVGNHADSDAIVRAVIGLASSLGIQTVAEGVERAAQFAWLRRAGCDLAQGFLFSGARAPGEVPDMLLEHGAVAMQVPVSEAVR